MGTCKFTLIDEETGQVIFNTRVILKSYDMNVRGGFTPVESVNGMIYEHSHDRSVELNMNAILINDLPKPVKKARFCDHVWVPYHGFTDHYTYCKVCGKKENES